MPQKLQINFSRGSNRYDVVIGSRSGMGRWARSCVGQTARKVMLVSNHRVFRLYGEPAVSSLKSSGFEVSHFLTRDGERYKTLRSAEAALAAFSDAGLSRTDVVVALGGGVVGDLAGFAASVYLRGIAFLQVPTTLLAMVDSSVGGKTGVNSSFGKNLIGTFHQPSGVLIDPDYLRTLPRRECTSAFCEMVKQGAVSGRSLLRETDSFLSKYGPYAFGTNWDRPGLAHAIESLIGAHVRFKASIVACDERESAAGSGSRSRKILNFGHTLAHALEKATNYRYFKHGEAVGYGILFAAEVSKSLALLGEKDIKLLYDVVRRVGPLAPLAGIDPGEVFRAFRFDKKNLSGSLQMVLIHGIGRPRIVTEQDLPPSRLQQILRSCFRKWA